MKILFSINNYDYEGDISERGVFLHFGEVRVRVCENESEIHDIVDQMQRIASEICGDEA